MQYIYVWLLLLSFSVLAQDAKDSAPKREFFEQGDMKEIVERIRQMRAELMRDFNSKDFYKDFEDLKKSFGQSQDSFMGFLGLDEEMSGDLYELKWKDTKEGKDLEIIPKDKQTELNIAVEGEMVTIKGKRTSKKGDAMSGVQQFEYSQNIPYDLDAAKNKISEKDGKIIVSFPRKEGVTQSWSSPRREGLPHDHPLRSKLREEKRRERRQLSPAKVDDGATPLFDAGKEDVI
jgi:HSP20 family molecular chaperone IbpA